jgi:hypothetical protein
VGHGPGGPRLRSSDRIIWPRRHGDSQCSGLHPLLFSARPIRPDPIVRRQAIALKSLSLGRTSLDPDAILDNAPPLLKRLVIYRAGVKSNESWRSGSDQKGTHQKSLSRTLDSSSMIDGRFNGHAELRTYYRQSGGLEGAGRNFRIADNTDITNERRVSRY